MVEQQSRLRSEEAADNWITIKEQIIVDLETKIQVLNNKQKKSFKTKIFNFKHFSS